MQFVHGFVELIQGIARQFGRFRQIVSAFGAVVLEPADVEVVAAFLDPFAREAAETAGFARVGALRQGVCTTVWVGAEGGFEVGKVIAGQRGALAELGHVGAKVVDPDFLCIALFRFAAGEEEHISLHALGVEDAGG